MDLEHCGVILAMLAEVVEHQLQLARSTEPAHRQDPRAVFCIIALVVQLLLDLLMEPRTQDIIRHRSERRVGVLAYKVGVGSESGV